MRLQVLQLLLCVGELQLELLDLCVGRVESAIVTDLGEDLVPNNSS